jgi:capsular exopolysaccharide synthesis family protein
MSLITLIDPRSAAAEAYRTLRSNIMFAGVEKPVHTLLVSSPLASEGKSQTAANLAVTLAQSGHSTILVDADLRRPAQHTLWNIGNDRGLTSMMLDKALLTAPPLQKTNVDGLSLLTSGPQAPNPADLLIGKTMETVIETLRNQADYVIFDAPPVLAVTDAPLLASKLDGLLLVIKAGATLRDHAERAKEVLERAHVRILGAVLTNAPRDTAQGSY